MASTTTAPQKPSAPQAGATSYDAFVSYSHAADGRLAPALQAGLQALAKPWHRRRALRVFRDKTSLSASPELWPAIEVALAESRFFVLVASPDAAGSRWVEEEVTWWRANRSHHTVLIALTDGELRWDEARGDFGPASAVPPGLRGWFPLEPLWVDLRWARDELDVSMRNPRFRDSVGELAAPLHGVPKDELIGEDIEVITGNCLQAMGEVPEVGADPDAAIRAAVEGYWAHVRSRPSEHQLSYELIQHSLRQPGEEQPAKDQYERYLAGIERFLTAVAQSGGFTWRGSPDALARLTLAVLQGVTFQWLAIQDDARARELLEQLVEVLQARVGQGPGR